MCFRFHTSVKHSKLDQFPYGPLASRVDTENIYPVVVDDNSVVADDDSVVASPPRVKQRVESDDFDVDQVAIATHHSRVSAGRSAASTVPVSSVPPALDDADGDVFQGADSDEH